MVAERWPPQMNMAKDIPQSGRPSGAGNSTSSDASPEPVGRLYRPVDWVTFWVVTLVVLLGYLYTLAPDLTLEDSGELAVGSMYAGVPHPPGYPVWTLYTWLFTKLLPFGNMAWRVGVSSAVAAAVSAGLVGLLVARGSSMILEGIPTFRDLGRRWEDRICLVAGFVSGMLIGFNGFIWSQAVIVEVYTLAVLTLMGVLAALLRWAWAPSQRRYLYLAFFFFGLCFCNHQTLIVAAMGLQVLVLMADRRVGRDFLLGNTLIWLLITLGHFAGKVGTFRENPALSGIFHLVGLASAGGFGWLLIQRPKSGTEWLRDAGLLAGLGLAAALVFRTAGYPASGTATPWVHLVLAAATLAGVAVMIHRTRRLDPGMTVVVAAGGAFLLGAAFYFYMPLASATNPPMNWGYPRTFDGFMHAFTRGQYEKTSPGISLAQVYFYFVGVKEEFNWANLLIGVIPFLFVRQMRERERGWLVGLAAVYACLAFILLYLLNAGVDKQSRELVKVFFTSSHVVVALAIGYGLALTSALLLTRYAEVRSWLLLGGAIASGFNLFQAVDVFTSTDFLAPRLAASVSLGLSCGFVALVLLWRERAHLAPVLGLFLLVPVDSILDHWADNEQRGHLFGYWFGHDMFEPGRDAGAKAPVDAEGKPLYPPMAADAVLFGGTDPGRFCPTYMIFCESFTDARHRLDPGFDRRDVYIITQNALADNTYLDYIRAHYNRSAQSDPPFFLSMLNDPRSMARGRTNFLAARFAGPDRVIMSVGERIERRRRIGESWFQPEHFADLPALQQRLRAGTDPLTVHLRTALGEPALSAGAPALAEALNGLLRDPGLAAPERIAGREWSPRLTRFIRQNPEGDARVRLNRLLLEEAYPGLLTGSPGGLYPDLEIHTPSDLDARRSFEEYTLDAQRRHRLNQLKDGEYVTQLPDGRVSVTGQTAVMAINGLLTKVIFDANPGHEFYVEESFPLDWMYPHLVPYGIIMKIEREPVARLSDDQIRRDHDYWSQYSARFIGNWIRYETPVREVCDFARRIYLRRDFTGFEGDRAFVRDDNAQKAFSKLRNAIGKSVYGWRAQEARDVKYQQALIQEAEFALKQAFAFCPYSPETVYNYASLLAGLGRYQDAYDVVATAYEFDEENAGIQGLLMQLDRIRGAAAPPQPGAAAASSQETFSALATNLEAAFTTASAWLQSGRSNEAIQLLDALMASPTADARTLVSLAQGFGELGRPDRMEAALARYAALVPESPEAWYDLAAIQAAQGKAATASSTLTKAIALSDGRRTRDPEARDLRAQVANDRRFDPVRPLLKLPD